MENQSKLLADLFDNKIVAVLACLLRKKNEFGIRELAREANVSTASTFRIIQKLAKTGLISRKRIGKSIFYYIRKDAEQYTALYSLIIGQRPGPLDVLMRELNENIISQR